MMQTELLKKDLKAVGEEISHELGAEMVKDYQVANPTDVKGYFIGNDILKKIMDQPCCVGIRFYNAYNEMGNKTLVCVGVDEAGKNIVEYRVVDAEGRLESQKGIVADRNGWWIDIFSGWI
jgi:hypothetical protein